MLKLVYYTFSFYNTILATQHHSSVPISRDRLVSLKTIPLVSHNPNIIPMMLMTMDQKPHARDPENTTTRHISDHTIGLTRDLLAAVTHRKKRMPRQRRSSTINLHNLHFLNTVGSFNSHVPPTSPLQLQAPPAAASSLSPARVSFFWFTLLSFNFYYKIVFLIGAQIGFLLPSSFLKYVWCD